MIKDISKVKTWHVWKVTYLRRNVTIVCGTSYHLLGSWISWDSKIRFQLQVKFYISNWQFSKSQHLARYVSHHNAMAYDRHIQSVWAIGMLSQGLIVAPLYRYTSQVSPRFRDSGSLENWKWCHNIMFEANVYLRLLHTCILDINKVFKPLVCCLKGIWLHPSSEVAPCPLLPWYCVKSSWNIWFRNYQHVFYLEKVIFHLGSDFFNLISFSFYKPIGPTARKSVQGRLLYHL